MAVIDYNDFEDMKDELETLQSRVLTLEDENNSWERICNGLKEENANLREALESIASKHKPRHAKEEYWLKISHEQCATVLATDTKIAREALASTSRTDKE